jgi:hypothetical protein
MMEAHMATAKRVTYFKAKIEDKPGSLYELVKNLRAKDLGLLSLKGISQGVHGEVLVVAKSPDKLRTAWTAAGLLIEEGTAFYLRGVDETGGLQTDLDVLAKAGVNIVATEAVASGRSYGAILWVDPKDVEKTAKALGAK